MDEWKTRESACASQRKHEHEPKPKPKHKITRYKRKTPNAKDKLTWNTLTKPPAHRRAHRGLLLGRRVHRRGRGPALGEERAAGGAHDACEARGREEARVEQVGEEPREEGRGEGAGEGEQVRERAGGRVGGVCLA